MKFDLSQSGLKTVITAGIVALVAIGIVLNWAEPVSAQNAAPAKPDTPTLRALHKGMVEVDWNDVSGANRYEVQFYMSSGWTDMPDAGLGIEIFFYGSRAVATGLPEDLSYDAFHVRAGNSVGWSEWSEYTWQMTTHNMDWEGVPVPAIEEEPPAPTNTPATGVPSISGTSQVGETLTADTSGIADDDGLTNVSYGYQWARNDGTDDSDISGATSRTYTLVEADQGKTIKVKVSFTDDADNHETLTSAATGEVEALPNWPATGGPTISGTALVGETLTADTSGIADADGLDDVSYSYQWIRTDGTSDTDTPGATDSTYALVAADEGQTIQVKVSFTDDADNEETLISAATGAVSFAVQQQQANSPATGAPSISGTAQVGELLTADTSGIADDDGLSGATYSYQWIRNDGTPDTDIADATDSTYTLGAADEGKTIKVRVSFTDDAANEESLTSEATAEVAAAGPPSHITVVVTEDTSDSNNIVSNFTVTWSDAANCSTNYNAYLHIRPGTRPGHETPGSQLHLGSAASGGAQIAKGLSDVQVPVQGFEVKLYCGTDGSGRLVSRVGISYDRADSGVLRPRPGTYSSEPKLIALSVSQGTLTPTFNSYTYRYPVPDVANADTRITITATPKTGYYVDFYEASEDAFVGGIYVRSRPLHGLSAECKRQRSYSDGGGPLVELTDADPDTPGFQVDLYDGDNYVHLRVGSIANCDLGTGYSLPITRAEGSLSLPRPNRPPTGLPIVSPRYDLGPYVGLTMIADASKIRDRDGRTNATFSYQWLADDTEITGATGSSYTVADTDLGKTLKVRGSFTDDRGTEESVTSVATKVVKLRNFDPSGKPIIVGFLRVGQTLSADVSGIHDSNGLTDATFRYEWVNFRGPVRDGEEYTLVDGDAGHSSRWMWVYYTDDAGHEERVTSDYVGDVAPRSDSAATGAPTISGTAQVGETLTADTSGIADDDGLTNVFSHGYQWIRTTGQRARHITSATDSTYTLVAADEGETIRVKVVFTDDAGNLETRTSAATSSVAARPNSPGTGAPTISGTAQVGETLTADTSGIAGTGGLMIGYRWIRNDGTSDTGILHATDSTYTLVAADEGKTIKVKVSLTDNAGNVETLTSTATSVVAARHNSAATGAPTITGNVHVRQRLTADTSGIADADGLTNVAYSYQWIANDGTSDTDITGATASTYILHTAYEGKTIKVRVSFTDDATNEETLTSEATAEVAAAGPRGDITVVVTEDASDSNVTNFTVTWSDAGDCSTHYNAYLHINPHTRPGYETPESILHLGSPASDEAQITKGLSDIQGNIEGFGVTLYCGTDGSGRLVRGIAIAGMYQPRPGTYSSVPPLIVLSVSHGTLTPTFNRYTYRYSVPDVANADTRITITATPETGHYVDFYELSEEPGERSGGVLTGLIMSGALDGISPDCKSMRSFFDSGGPLVELTDADPDTPGFQVDLYDGGNYVQVRVPSIAFCDHGTAYTLAITRAEGSLSLPRPNRPPTGLPIFSGYFPDGLEVGDSIYADVSTIRDRDGLVPGNWILDRDLTFLPSAALSFQWLADDAEITGATGSSYTVTAAELGKTLKVRVSFTDDRGTEESVTSVATKVVKLRNFDPSGKPIIVGFLRVGQTLRADVSGISDPNGMTNATFSYEWVNFHGPVRDGEEYTLVDGDGGRCGCWLWVYYTDDAGHEERVSSDPIEVVAPPSNSAATGAPSISGTAQVGETLTVDTMGIADDDGLNNVSYSYQWIRNDGSSDTDIENATGSSYTLAAAAEGQAIKVRVSFTDDADNEETLTSSATAAVDAAPNTPATGAPAISGTTQVGETLTADTSNIADDDGLTGATFAYQWLAADAEIASANEGTYVLTSNEMDKTIKVRVSFTDDDGNEETLTSSATEVVSPTVQQQQSSNTLATGAPTISGTALVGETLTADTSGIADADGLDDVSYSYQWIRTDGTSDTDTPGATDSTYALVAADEGQTIQVKVSFTDDADNEETLISAATGAVSFAVQQQQANSPATGAPTIRGTAQVGETLTADTSGIADDDGLSGATYSYQWIRNDGTSDTDIADATDSTYTLTAADVGKTIKVRVSFTDNAGNAETLTSAATAAVAARPAPGTAPDTPDKPTGTAVFVGGEDLEWNEVPAADSYAVQLYRNGQWVDLPGDGVEIAFYGAGAIISELDPDSTLWFQVRAKNAHGSSEWSDFSSMASTSQFKLGRRDRPANVPASGAPVINGTAQAGETLTADTTGIEDGNGLDRVQFRVQWVSHDGSADKDIASATDSTYTLAASDEGKTIKVRVAFTDRGGNDESLTSPATATVAAAPNSPATGAPAVTGTALVGETLTADTTGIADADGLSGATFTYQWIANDGTADTDIQDATDSTYTLVADDEGKTVKVRVSFTDDAGTVETLTSTATNSVAARPNSAATGAPTINGTVQVGETLTADTSGIGDADGLNNVSYSYQWVANDGTSDTDITGGTDSTYTLVAADEDQTIKVRVSFTDDAGSEETLTSAATGAVAGAVAAAPSSYITVAVTEDSSDSDNIITNFTVTWSDSDDCSTNYNIYLAVSPSGNEAEISRTHLGSAASGSTQATPAISFRGQPFHPTLELYCGAYDAGSSQNVLVASTELFRWNFIGLKEGTYSSAPLTALTISSGTLSPDFDRGIYSYAAELPSDVEVITLDPAVLTGYQTDFVKNPSGWIFSVCRLSAYCDYYYGDGRTTGIALSDADTNTYGFQVNLDRGENRLGISVNGGSSGPGPPKFYRLTVTVQNSPATVQNSPATGQPTISGTAQVGETLTVDTSGISDVDGLDSVSFSYQWLSSRDTDTPGATDSTYALVAADEGQTIQVKVSFTDDAANAESLTSAATAEVAARPNTPATGTPTISGTAKVGETLTADTSGIADADRLTNVSYSYQWVANDGSADTDIQDATDSTYTLVAADEGQTIKVRVSFTDDAGNQETLTSAPTAVVAAPAQVDSENEPSELSHLTVVVTEDDSDPDDVVSTFTITWNDAEDCSSSYNAYLDGVVGEPIHLGSAASEGEQIAGSLTNVSAEAFGFNVKLHCGTIGSGRLVDRLWIPEYNRSFGTLPISRAYLPKPGTYSTEPGLIALTVSSGTLTPAFHNQTLNYTVPDVPNADGRFTLTTTAKADYYTVAFLPGSYYTFFSVCSYGGQQTSLFYGDDAGNQIYPLTDADANTPGFQMDLDEGENVFYIRVWPNCQTGQLYKLTVTRAANAPANTPATGAPTIGGTARVGQTLTADTTGIADSDGLENATFAYQWLADDTDIADATDSTYTLVAAAEGKTIKVRVSFTDDADNDETLTSAATGEVEALPNRPATGAPTISGTAQVGEALTADTSGIADDDGLNNVSYSYQWIRNDGSSDTDITDATGSTYPLVEADQGKTIKVKVTFTDDADNEETLTSDATAEVAAAAPTEPPGRPRNLTGTANSDGTVTLRWDAPNDDSVTGYQVLRRRPRAGEPTLLVHVNDTGSTATEYTDNDVTPDVGHAYRVKAINAVGLSRQSNFVSITPTQPAEPAQNSAATGTPTISGTAQVGETLTADTSGIADADGLTNVSYSYQWIPNDGSFDTDNQDATGSTYTLADSDEGKTIKVEVSFTDDAGNGESLTSAATATVASSNLAAGICDRTEQVQDAILGMLNGVVDDCADVTDSHLAGITIGLRISNGPYDRQALSLQSGDFAGLVNIEQLAIYYHTMDALPEDVFDGLGSLESLDLSDNEIAALPEGVFNGLGSLERLDLRGNQLGTLPEGVFNGLGNLESLDLRGNQLGALPEGVFNGLGNLESLDLRGNQLGTLPEGVFNGLGNLESLELFGNRINALPEDVFDGLGNLTYLGLSFNQLSALPDDVFDDLGNLEQLYLFKNQLGTLPEGVFNGLSSLERLNLSYNEIAALPEDVFDGLGNLKSLRLDSNDLASPPEDVFDGLDSLTHLTLSHNRIHTLPEDVFEGLGNLTSLGLGNNQINVLPEDVFDELGNLTSLGLGGNQLGALPEGVFDELGNLTSLDLGNNRIGRLAEDFFDELGNLTSLDLSGNRLGAVPEGFFDELGNLTYLSLYRNQIRALPEDVFEGLGNLTSLNLHANQISVLPEDVFDGLGNLNKLYLNENQLSALPEDVFDGLSNLNELYLFENQISALPEDVFDGLSNLNELYLYGNQISALPEDVFDGLSNLNGLYLWGNPGTPFTLTAYLERQGDNAVLVKVAEGVPFDMAVTLSATGGTLSAASVTINGGTADSEAVTVTRSGDGPVTVSVVSAVFQAGDYNGIQAGLGEPLILGDAEGDNRPATGTPAISGTAQVGETLTADTSGIADDDGLTNVSYGYQWVANDGGTDADISGETDATYTLVADDVGKTIKVKVTFTDDAGNEATLTSVATDAVEAPQPPAKPTGLSAAAVSHDTVTLAWDDPQDDSITGYVILRRDREIHPVGTFVTITGDTGSADTTYTDDTVEPDKEYVYRIKAINEHGKVSEESDWVRADTPAVPVPDKPTGLSAAVSHDTVTLTWDDPQDDSITGYVILRRDREIHLVGTFVTITGDTGSADTTYTDDTVEPDKEYVYRIKAINEHGEVSEESDWVRGFTPAAPAPAGSPAK